MKPITQYEEIMRALETTDKWLEDNPPPEFEDLNDPERPFRMEYMHESRTESKTRYKRIDIDV